MGLGFNPGTGWSFTCEKVGISAKPTHSAMMNRPCFYMVKGMVARE